MKFSKTYGVKSERYVDFYDAKYMLVTCGVFVNHVEEKVS